MLRRKREHKYMLEILRARIETAKLRWEASEGIKVKHRARKKVKQLDD